MILRVLEQYLLPTTTRRLIMITGARQTGKTTLAQTAYPDIRYISLDEVEARRQLREMPTQAWASTVGAAVLDEAQKEPSVFEKIKFAYDKGDIDFSVLLGSAQITLLSKVKESLAGRVFTYHLWPLMLCEVTNTSPTIAPPLFDRILNSDEMADEFFSQIPVTLLGEEGYQREQWLDYLLKWGGMPELPSLNEQERRMWLNSYTNTYLERDLSDIARIDDLVPFRRFLQICAHRSSHVLSYADLARDVDISPSTARNYLSYVNLSHQSFLLQPYFSNKIKRLIKAPKFYWTDPGLWRHQTGYWGDVTGELLETFVISECAKWIQTTHAQAEMWYYRSHGGLEVDLLVKSSAGIWGIEIKSSPKAKRAHGSSLRKVAAHLGEEWRGGIVAYMGNQITQLDQNIWAVPISRLFSA